MNTSIPNFSQENFSELGIDKLTSVFNRTTASYKFYWLISIVELVEQGYIQIPKKKIFARMISNSWYTINYFKVSYGKADQLERIVHELLIHEPALGIDSNRDLVNFTIENSKNKSTNALLRLLDNNVPHWLLSTWFPSLKQAEIYAKSKLFDNDCLYALFPNHIIINPSWESFLLKNAKLIKDFCFWNLSLFLQAKNPNVPDISNKLFKDAARNSLLKQTNQYWKLVFQELGTIDCIFSGKRLSFEDKNFSIDHFVPYSFVSHDLIWNLYPIDKSENSKKSNYLPRIETHFNPFFLLQKQAFEIIKFRDSKNKFLLDFLPITPELKEIKHENLLNTIQPLITIANNNGFQFYNFA
jgi:hypothetical protein